VTEITPFTFPTTGQTVRTVVIDDEPWWIAKDVCNVLGYEHTPSAIRRLDDDEYSQFTPNVRPADSGPPTRPMTIVNESGLYSLILWSAKPEAKPFRRWVTHELLPAVRKTGAYSVAPAPVTIDSVITALAELAYREHVVPFAGRTLAFQRWRKPRKGMQAFVQLTIDLKLPGIDGTDTKAIAQ
jgi:anti-repressor protein